MAIGTATKLEENVTSSEFAARSRIRQRVANRLTVNAVRHAHKPGKYADGNGLWLIVEATERRYWHFRYQWQGRQRSMSFGSVDQIGLPEARTLHAQARALVARGVDPLAQRKAGVPISVPSPVIDLAAPSFAFAVDEYLAAHEAGWKNPKHRQQWRNTLTALYPAIGDVPIATLDTSHVLQVLQPIWQATPESASRLRGRVEAVIDYASVRGWRERGPNPAAWRGHLKHALPAKAKLRPTEPHPALPWREAPAFMACLREQAGMGALALQFAILTAARSGEVRGARWEEIDLTHGVWTVPPRRDNGTGMKNGKVHRVPLSRPALMILLRLAEIRDGSGLIFFGRERRKLLSDMSLTAVLRRMGRGDITQHGFRSTFRDWAADNGKPADAAERALAHVLGGTRGAYERTDLLEARQTLMAEWACYLERPAAEVVQMIPRITGDASEATPAPRGRRRTIEPAQAPGAA
jgi:integrase